ncbi:MAG: putative lipid II flippase FtsW [Dehalococcoidia bacterium]
MVATVMLLITGLLAVYTSSFALAYHEYGDPNYFVARQAVFALAGVAALVFFMRIDYNRLRQWSVPMLLIALAGLVLVLSPVGVERNGAARWLMLGPISVQPSEFAKLAVLVYVSAWLASRGQNIKEFSLGFVPFILMLSVVGALIIAEPDMGTTVIVVLVACTLFFVAGAPLTHLALLLSVGGAACYMVISTREYQLDRLTSFISPESDPQGVGFQIIQLLTAIGSGGPLGIGWAESRQKHLYLPGAHTDGVFAILGEELGFVGLMGILALFGFFIFRALRVTMRTNDSFAMLLGVGVTSWIAFQTLINIAGITRTIPLTGVPLPFLSYGGSALISLMAGVGILLSVSRYTSEVPIHERARPQTRTTFRPPKERQRGPVFERGPA